MFKNRERKNMSGRPVQLLAAAAVAAVASFASVSAASAGCYSGCGYTTYAPPVAYYSAPVVYSYSYARPVAYAAPCTPCGYSYGYAVRPMYVVNQGPAYTEPVTIGAEPTPGYSYGYRRAYPYYAGGVRWHRHWKHRWGHRGFGPRFGYGPRRFHRGFVAPRYRMGAVVPGYRMMGRPHHFRGAVPPRMRAGIVMPRHMGMRHMGMPRHMGAPHRMGKPGSVQPMMGPKKKLP
jgi:hypothetical protein